MKSSPVLALLILTFLSGTAAAQARAAIQFDMRSESQAQRSFTRSRPLERSGGSTNASAADIEQQIFALINAERARNGLSELVWSERVAAVARLHSQDMARVKFFSHRGSDGSMVDERADRLGLGSWLSICENIAYMRGFDDPAGLAVQKWLESTAHRKNLLGPRWQESAVGVAVTPDGTYYMTEVFLLRK